MNISELDFNNHPANLGGTMAKVFFNNGFGASVITGEMFYSSSDRPYEIAVLKGDSVSSELTYDSGLTSDVMGYLTEEEANKALSDIEAL